MTDADKILKLIVTGGADELSALAYADWLEEQGDSRDLLRAEFIRVQVEMESVRSQCLCGDCVRRRGRGQHTNGKCLLDFVDHRHLRQRECELLFCSRLYDKNNWFLWAPGCLQRAYRIKGEEASSCDWEFRLGFIHTVRCTLRAWLKIGPELVRTAPVARVELNDKSPSNMEHGWEWFSERNGWSWRQNPEVLPNFIFDLIPNPIFRNGVHTRHCDLSDCVGAVSVALLAWARLPECVCCRGRGLTEFAERQPGEWIVASGEQTLTCAQCSGSGRILREKRMCGACLGQGGEMLDSGGTTPWGDPVDSWYACSECGGSGEIAIDESL